MLFSYLKYKSQDYWLWAKDKSCKVWTVKKKKKPNDLNFDRFIAVVPLCDRAREKWSCVTCKLSKLEHKNEKQRAAFHLLDGVNVVFIF